MIIYKSLFGVIEVDLERAVKVANHLYQKGTPAIQDEEKIKRINSYFEGVEFEIVNGKIEVKK